jgi:hypothetical protein
MTDIGEGEIEEGTRESPRTVIELADSPTPFFLNILHANVQYKYKYNLLKTLYVSIEFH